MADMLKTVNVFEDKRWKLSFYVLSALVMLIMLFISKDYGQTGDEWLQIEYGQHIWNYFFNGDTQALDYSNKNLQYQSQEMYGGLFDFYTEVLHRWLPSIDVLRLRHFCNALFGGVLMISTGLLAKRLSGSWLTAILALLFMFFSPRILGESMNNPKDIPFACGFMLGLYSLIAFLQDFPNGKWKHVAGLAIGWGITFGIRSAGGLLLGAYFVFFIAMYYFLNKDWRVKMQADNNKLLKNFALLFIIAIGIGYALGMSAWPWGLQDPISAPFTALKEMANRNVQLLVLFEGKYKMNNMMPWYYEFKWIIMSNPLIVIIGAFAFVALISQISKKHGLFTAGLLLFCSCFPILYMIYKHSSVHDTWRHVFFVYPAWVLMAAMSVDIISRMITNHKLKLVPYGIAVLGLLPAVIWTVRSHPNQYVYFNEIQGGAAGAYGSYDLDYYQNSGKQCADWIKKNVKPIPGRKVIVLSNMSGYEKYFVNDTSWIAAGYGRYKERHYLNCDYYVTNPRYVDPVQMLNGVWPPQNAVYMPTADGKPLSAVIKMKSKAGIEAKAAFDKQDFATAATKYAEYLANDNTSDDLVYFYYAYALANLGQFDKAIDAANNASKIDPGSINYLEFIAQMYQTKGDTQKLQETVLRINALKLELAEEQYEEQ